jgi:Preprotein translocase subunit SecA (ATPase, RNA helicase)
MNQQREVIYEQRRRILIKGDLRENIIDMINRLVDRTMTMYAPPEVYSEEWDLPAMIAYAEEFYAPEGKLTVEHLQTLSREELDEYLHETAINHYEERENMMGSGVMRELENLVMLKVVDSQWMEHLDAMDMLREGVGLRAYGQRDPLVEYKFEAYDMFEAMKGAIQDDVVRYIYRVNLVSQPKVEDHLANASVNNPSGDSETEKKQPLHNKNEIGRNDPCPWW